LIYDKHFTLGIAILIAYEGMEISFPSWAMRMAIPRLFHSTLLYFQ
jgi:hypothetical protein